MNPNRTIVELVRLGYRFEIHGDKVRYSYHGPDRPDPATVRPLLETLKARKPEVVTYLKAESARAIGQPCTSCPWCMDNPWTHYPDLPLWCGWWWDHLAADGGQCRERQEGRVPDPEPRKTDPLRGPRSAACEGGKGLSFTCFECAHFRPAEASPNPRGAWGECRKLGRGRYGVARSCDAFVSRAEEKKEAELKKPAWRSRA